MAKKSDKRNNLKYLSLGMEIAAGLSVPLLIGFWLDMRWNLTPWLTLTGIFIGLLILAGTITRLARNTNQKDQTD